MVEGIEDSEEIGVFDFKIIGFIEDDIVIVIVVSGCILYVVGVLKYVKIIGVKIVVFICNKYLLISMYVDYSIEVVVGFEVIIGLI